MPELEMDSDVLFLARHALMDPAQRGRTIGEIAKANGFAHRTSFIRAIERDYSLTPSQQRALASERLRASGASAAAHPSFRRIEIA